MHPQTRKISENEVVECVQSIASSFGCFSELKICSRTLTSRSGSNASVKSNCSSDEFERYAATSCRFEQRFKHSSNVSQQTILICLLSFALRPSDTIEKGLKSRVFTSNPFAGRSDICFRNCRRLAFYLRLDSYLGECVRIRDGDVAIEPSRCDGVKLSRDKTTCRYITKDVIDPTRCVRMKGSKDLVEDFIGDVVKW